jgi:aminocarboxymuconate-semialdehyde decarboxylase
VQSEVQSILLDVHAHLIPAAEAGLADFEGVSWEAQSCKFAVDGHAVGIRSLFRPRDLLAWMDENRIARAWISVPPPVYRPHLDQATATRWIVALNEGLAVIAAAHPSRLAPLFHLPAEHPELAAAIAAEKIALGHARFSMAAGGTGHVLSAKGLEPLWQILNDARGFLFLHPGEGCDPRLDPFYLHNLLGNPTETAIAASHLIFAGILQRFADLTICLAHAGGSTAALAGRWQRGQITARPGIDLAREAPRQALRRFCADCIAHDDGALHLVAETFGRDRILFGSDWPFPMGLLEPHKQLAQADPRLRQAMFCDNPTAMLRR